MSKTKITDKTEIIEAKPEMLNYFYYKEVFCEFNDSIYTGKFINFRAR